MGYGSGTGLWLIQTTDIDKYYENDGTIIDMYSENLAANTPGISNDPTIQMGTSFCGWKPMWKLFKTRKCYNREHSIPKSFLGTKCNTNVA
jgi:beta-galactosidase/beta-glucuronidase